MLIGPIDINIIKDVIDCISDGIQIYNADGYLVYCNEKCEMLDDIMSKSAIGKHVTSIYPPLRDGANTIIKVLRSGQPIYNLEQDYINYRGRRLTAITTTLPLTYHQKTVGVIEITRSLTENRELNEKIEKLRIEAEALRLSGDIGMLLGDTDKSGELAAEKSIVNRFSGDGAMDEEGAADAVEIAEEKDYIFEKDEFVGFERVMQIFEKRIISTVFRQCGYNVTDTAHRLKIPRQTLQYKMKKYHILKPRTKDADMSE